MRMLIWPYIVVWFQVRKGNSHHKDLMYKLKQMFEELHCYLTYIYIIFLSLLPYMSAYYICFLNLTSNRIFEGIIHPIVLLKAETKNSCILECNSVIRNWKNACAEAQIVDEENLQFWNFNSEWAPRGLHTLKRTVKYVLMRRFIPKKITQKLKFSNLHFDKVEK